MNINFRSQRLLQGYDFLQSQSETKPIKVLVHEFIQSVVFTPFPQDSELQVERLVLAGNIYDSVGFKRKAAFYRRFAALKEVTVQSDWQACYDALLGAIDGFGLTLDPNEYERSLADKCSSVWPGIHVQLIEELITCCKKIATPQAGSLAIRHMSFLLHTLDFYLSDQKKRDLAHDLEEASTIFGEDSPVPLRLPNGYVVPTVNLTKYPLCLRLEPQPLPLALRPVRVTQLRRRSAMSGVKETASDNPFIYTPMTSYTSMSLYETRRTDTMITDIVWVQDDPCSTLMIVKNILPFELRISSINLLTDGVPLETKTYSIDLDADSISPTSINLVGIPRQYPRTTEDCASGASNRIEIFGYSTHCLGVKSTCRLDMLSKSRFCNQYIVEVAPPLPRIEFQFPENQDDSIVDYIPADQVGKELIVMEVKISVKPNELVQTHLTILNSSNVDVSYMHTTVKLREYKSSHCDRTIPITWDQSVLEKLNISPLKSGEKLDLPMTIQAPAKETDAQDYIVTFEYSGGLALEEMYCRRCAILATLELRDVIESAVDVVEDTADANANANDLGPENAQTVDDTS